MRLLLETWPYQSFFQHIFSSLKPMRLGVKILKLFLSFIRRLYTSGSKMPAKFESNWNILNTNLSPLRDLMIHLLYNIVTRSWSSLFWNRNVCISIQIALLYFSTIYCDSERQEKAQALVTGCYDLFNVQGSSYLGITRSISWLLMPWLLASPGHSNHDIDYGK